LKLNKGIINYTDINDTNGNKLKDIKAWKAFLKVHQEEMNFM
jgi:hypothetical protein